ncbi:MAG TPA: 16S rRNA (cytidine(1402)-2'-O)-methyltransferase [Rhodocyclaceae bacterium]|nr:16S rRNA (cytidine(1402)-2'-O)-methyltransferase [Rhodocyclaceae bacterium]
MTTPSAPSADSPLVPTAALYVVATPLGHAQDITLRALTILGAVDIVAAEDTRHSQKLLDAHGIRTRMLALHEHNEQQGATEVIRLLAAGKHVGLITDAGTPAISDPGARVVARVQAAGYRVVPVPGPSAVITALSASGLSAPRFHFAGFLPTKSAARRTAIEALRSIDAVLVFYEAPHRIRECVEDMAATLEPERDIVFCRELTKLFEQIVRMPLAEAPAWLAADTNRQRGEFVLLVGPAPIGEGIAPEAQRMLKLLLEELPVKTAARLVSEITGASKNALYDFALELRNK